MLWIKWQLHRQLIHCSFILGVGCLSCTSDGKETRTYVNEGVLCQSSLPAMGGSNAGSYELGVVFDQCASYCAEVVEATCEVRERTGQLFVEARASTREASDNEPCPGACKRIGANCGFLVEPDSDAQVEFAGETVLLSEIEVQCAIE